MNIYVSLLIAVCLQPWTAMAQGSGIITLDNRPALTDQDVIAMSRAKLSDAILVKAIHANRTNFDVSAAALIRLQNSGVSQAVIEAMLSSVSTKTGAVSSPSPDVDSTVGQPQPEPAAAPAPVSTNDLPDDVGVWIKQNGKLTAVDPEIVNWKSGGVLKTTATLGIDKGHVNGTIPGQHSSFNVTEPLEFYIRCQEGNSASEYQLLHFWDKGNRREFRAVTGGILHRSGGAQPNEVPFKYDKVAPRVYKIQITNLQPGAMAFSLPVRPQVRMPHRSARLTPSEF